MYVYTSPPVALQPVFGPWPPRSPSSSLLSFLLPPSRPVPYLEQMYGVTLKSIISSTSGLHCATSRAVSESIPGGVTGDFFRDYQQDHVPWGRISL